MKDKFNLLNRSDFFKNLLTLVTGTTAAQFIPILLQPILRRVFTPEDFGVYAIYLSVIGVIAMMVNTKYEMAVVLPKSDKDAMNVVSLALLVSLLVCSLLFIVALCFSDAILDLIKLPSGYKYVLFILPFSIFFLGFYQAVNMWLVRKKNFKRSSFNKITRRGVEGAFQTGSGFVITGPVGLIVGNLLGNLINVLAGMRQLIKTGFSLSEVNVSGIVEMAKRYKQFPMYNTVPALLNSLSLLLPVFIINELFSTADVGQFDLSRQVLAVPLSLVATALGQVLFQHVTESINNSKSIKPLIIKILKISVGGSLAAILIFQLFAPELFSFIFGDEWVLSGSMSQILIFSYGIKFVVSPLSIILTAFEKLKTIAVWQLLYFALICCLYLFQYLPLLDLLIVYVCIDLFAYMVYIILIISSVNKYEKTIA